MSTYFDDVGEFHRKFNIPAFDPRKPTEFPSPEILEYRTKFLEEELIEFKEALASGDIAKALDALADIAYVAFGTAHYFNAPFDDVWKEVQRANLDRVLVTRENCPPDKQYRADMVIKPPGWIEPQIKTIVDIQNKFARRMIGRLR